ncbi:uncharacterized protein [Leptinotarsa decemlineata]|uniref:uncharacterized protein n=1 Tax=Leptinotarsa decemlineata TaxID=7539 RepID=UPI003D309384
MVLNTLNFSFWCSELIWMFLLSTPIFPIDTMAHSSVNNANSDIELQTNFVIEMKMKIMTLMMEMRISNTAWSLINKIELLTESSEQIQTPNLKKTRSQMRHEKKNKKWKNLEIKKKKMKQKR